MPRRLPLKGQEKGCPDLDLGEYLASGCVLCSKA